MMRMRYPAVTLALGVVIWFGATADLSAQATSNGGWTLPRTEWGHPDLQGNWTNATVTPLERPAGQGPTMSPEEVARIEEQRIRRRELANLPSDPNRPAPPVGGDGSTGAAGGVGGYNSVYIESGDRVAFVNGEARTSLIVNPPNGRIPATNAQARQRQAASRAGLPQMGQYDNPENRPLGERCLISFGSNAGPPMLPNGFYNNNYTIVQNKDHVLIMTEMIHDVRIIRLADGPRLPADMRPWFGDSWGRWEGNTLVIETTNLNPMQRLRSVPSDDLKVIERLTRVDDETILYEFTVDDPTSYDQTWGGEIPFMKLDGNLYEYACHEGNYSLMNVLSGARYQERMAEEGAARQ
jgi:hypothetical protein